MHTKLDELIQKAFESNGATADVNQVYLTLLKTDLFFPAYLHEQSSEHENPFTPLFIKHDEIIFMPVFDTLEKLQQWMGDHEPNTYVTMKGSNVIARVGDTLYLALNPATSLYKEFDPDEIRRLKTIVQKIDQFKPK